jgi:hypothetical protein
VSLDTTLFLRNIISLILYSTIFLFHTRFHPIPNIVLSKSILTSKISLLFYIFPTSFLPLFSLFYTYPYSPFPFSLLFSLSNSILSHFFRTMGSRVGGLNNPDLQSTLSHIKSTQPPHYLIHIHFFNREFPGWRVRTLTSHAS